MPKLPALPYIRSGITEGLSANESFRRYQQAATEASGQTGAHWTASRRTVFLQQYAQTRNVRSQVVAAMNAPKNEPGGGLQVPTRTTERATGILNWGVGFSRVIGSSEVEQTFHAVRSAQPLTPQEVEDIIREQIQASSEEAHGSFANHVIEGVIFTGVENMIPRGQ